MARSVVGAFEIVERALESRNAPVYVRRQFVHNATAVEDLAERGAVFVDELDEVSDNATVVFSAHVVSPAVREQGLNRVFGGRGSGCAPAG
ncbi:hypothetical protein ABZS96_43825 [Streptomyces avermitilis]|uniref:hypothetical protein n=1 Tax=Streptomyces avermitilis TaxID=33903 RepID=UPI0033BDB6E8